MPRQVHKQNKRLSAFRPRLSQLGTAALLAGMLSTAQAATCTTGPGISQIGVQLFALQAYDDGTFDYSWRQLQCQGGQVVTLVDTVVQGQYPDQAIADNRRLNMSRVIRNACGSMAVIVHDRFRGTINDGQSSVDFSALPLNSENFDLFSQGLDDSEGAPIPCPNQTADYKPPFDYCPNPAFASGPSGGEPPDGAHIGNPITPATAEKIQIEQDWVSSRSSVAAHSSAPSALLRFERQWVSGRVEAAADMQHPARPSSGARLGPGWGHNHDARLFKTPDDAYAAHHAGSGGAGHSGGIGTGSGGGSGVDTGGTATHAPLVLVLPGGQVRHFLRQADGRYTLLHPEVSSSSPPPAADADPTETLQDQIGGGHLYTNHLRGEQWLFDHTGHLLSRTWRNGWQHSYQYGAEGMLTRVDAPFGQWLTLEYGSANGKVLLSAIRSHDGSHTTYRYDNQGRLSLVTHADGAKRQYLYEDPKRPELLTGIVGETGQRIATYAYDDKGRAILSEQGQGTSRYQLTYSGPPAPGRLQSGATITTPDSQSRSYQYQAKGRHWAVTGASHPPADESLPPIRSRQLGEQGLLASETDFLGTQNQYQWDNHRHLPTRHTRAQGKPEQQHTQTEWHPQWALPIKVTETGAQGGSRVTAYEYDHQGNLTRQTLTGDNLPTTERRWSYNTQGLLASETDEAGHTTRHQYDAQGNRTQSTDALGRQSQSSYDAAGRLLSHTSFEGITTTYTWDVRGRLLTQSVQTPTGPLTTAYTWRPDGQISQITQPEGLTITYQYDPAGRLTGWQNNRGHSGSYTLDAAGRITQEEITDAQGAAWQRNLSWSNTGRLQSQTQPGQSTTYGFNANGDLSTQTNGLNQRWQLTRDGLRRVTARQNPQGHRAQIAFNSLNDITQAKDFKGVATQYNRDAQGQPTQEASADIGSQNTSYDPRGLPTRHQDAAGRVQNRQYDALGRISQIEWQDTSSGNTQTAQFSYSPSGHISRIQEQGQHTAWQHDAAGRITHKYQAIEAGSNNGNNANTAPTAYALSLNYVPAGQGGAGQIAQLSYPSGHTLQYRYDSSGQLSSLLWRGQPLVTNLQWTALGLPASWQWAFNGQSAQRQYSPAGQLIQTESAQYQYDRAGRLKQIQWQLMAPAANGQSQSLPVQTQITHDANGRLTGVQHTPGAASLPAPWRVQDLLGPLQSTYAWDANGNRQSASYQGFGESAQTQSFKRQFTLAPEHNKVLAVTETTQQGNGSQSQQNHTLQWDASGKLQGNGHIHFQRDAAGRVQQTQNQHNDTTTYITNALSQRIRKQTGPSTNRLITDTVYGEDSIAPGLQSFALGHYEHRQTAQGTVPTLTSEYIYIPTPMGPMPIAAEINGRLYAIHTDQLNTPRQLTDENGQKVWQWGISGFGELEPTTAETGWVRERNGSAGQISNTLPVTFNLRFPGQQFDKETGLHYNHHRYYDPQWTVGYTEADPLGLEAGWNRFVYVDGGPLDSVDPEGLETYICKRPIGGVPGDFAPPVFNHTYVCVGSSSKDMICGSTTGESMNHWSQAFSGTAGQPTTSNSDYYHPNACRRRWGQDRCIESCITIQLAIPTRPRYAIGPFGTDCQEYTESIVRMCERRCVRR